MQLLVNEGLLSNKGYTGKKCEQAQLERDYIID